MWIVVQKPRHCILPIIYSTLLLAGICLFTYQLVPLVWHPCGSFLSVFTSWPAGHMVPVFLVVCLFLACCVVQLMAASLESFAGNGKLFLLVFTCKNKLQLDVHICVEVNLNLWQSWNSWNRASYSQNALTRWNFHSARTNYAQKDASPPPKKLCL